MATPPAIKISNREFLEALAGKDWPRVPIAWGENTWWVKPAGENIDKPDVETSNYFCVSLFDCPPGAKFRRTKELFERQFVFVIDDVGTKLNEAAVRATMPLSTYELETSPNNWQFGYKLALGTDARALEALVSAIVDDPEINPSLADPGMKGVTRVVRLPVGSNNKEKWVTDGKGWPHRLTVWSPGVAYTVAQLALSLGVDLGEKALEKFKGAGGTRKATEEELAADGLMRLFDARGMILDPNINDNGFVTVVCPWADSHSDARNEAGYRPGRRGFQCHHGHCETRTMVDLDRWAHETATPQERAELFGEVFPDTPGDDDRISKIAQAATGAEAAKAKEHAATRKAAQEENNVKVKPIAAKWTFVYQLGKFGYTVDGVLYDEKNFNRMNTAVSDYGSSGKSTAAAMFLNSTETVRCRTATYYPGRPMIYEDPHDGTNIFNTWRPGPVSPWAFDMSEDDIKPWLDHAAYILPDPVAREKLLQWCAFVIQNPGKKINWAYLLIGPQGIGKDTLLFPIWEIVGSDNYKQVNPKMMESQFNEWAEKQVIILPELPSFHKQDVYDWLKEYVAPGAPEFNVNKKNQTPYSIPNLQNWFLFSNHEDALKLEDDDRRFFVYASPAEKREPAYYTGLRNQGKGLFEDAVFQSKLYAWLLDYDLADFNPGEAPPMTDAKARMMEETRHPVDRWMDEQFDGGKYEGRKLIQTSEILSDVQSSGRHNGVANDVARTINQTRIGRWFRKKGWRQLGRRRLPTYGRVWLWVAPLEPFELIDQLYPSQLEARYLKDAGLPVPAVVGGETGKTDSPF